MKPSLNLGKQRLGEICYFCIFYSSYDHEKDPPDSLCAPSKYNDVCAKPRKFIFPDSLQG